MREELKRLQSELGITFVHVTHSQEEALALADLIVVMNAGRIEQCGPPRDVYRTPQTAFVARFMGGHNMFAGRLIDTEQPCTLMATPRCPFHKFAASQAAARLYGLGGYKARSNR
jgi:putative spermidine/putrescine transport system ATP-binding protein